MSARFIDLLVATALLALMIASTEAGYPLDARRESTSEERSQVDLPNTLRMASYY